MTEIRPDLFEKAVKSIGGSNPPIWLAKGLPDIVQIINGNIKIENSRLSREDWRKQFRETAKSARYLLDKLQDSKGFFPMLLNDVGERLYCEYEVLRGLEAIESRCEEKLQKLPKTKGGGKTNAEIDETPDGKTLCALAVGLAWERIGNKWPGVHNESAQRACRDLWKAAGGDRLAWGNTPAGWRDDLKKARSLRESWQAKVLIKQWGGCKLKRLN